MPPQGFAGGGFVAVDGLPRRERPDDWLVWHFTHADNLGPIVAAGALLAESSGVAFTNIASTEIKNLRRTRAVSPLDGLYPAGLVVADHVPWYVAARSPMLDCVCRGYTVDYTGGPEPLVFFGVRIGDLAPAGLTWCFSDRNAAAPFASFSVDTSHMGAFMDFELLSQARWDNTRDDPDRKSRRAAEVLVAHHVPIDLVSVVVTYNAQRQRQARACMSSVTGTRQYVVKPELYY